MDDKGERPLTQDYYGTKRVTAWQETREGREGYGLRYPDGYQSWSPRAQFEASYQPITAMSFGHAITAMKAGHRVARAGWNGRGMWLMLVRSAWVAQDHEPAYVVAGGPPDKEGLQMLPWIGMKTADHGFVPWLASQTDMLADDWSIVE